MTELQKDKLKNAMLSREDVVYRKGIINQTILSLETIMENDRHFSDTATAHKLNEAYDALVFQRNVELANEYEFVTRLIETILNED